MVESATSAATRRTAPTPPAASTRGNRTPRGGPGSTHRVTAAQGSAEPGISCPSPSALVVMSTQVNPTSAKPGTRNPNPEPRTRSSSPSRPRRGAGLPGRAWALVVVGGGGAGALLVGAPRAAGGQDWRPPPTTRLSLEAETLDGGFLTGSTLDPHSLLRPQVGLEHEGPGDPRKTLSLAMFRLARAISGTIRLGRA